MSTSFQDLLKKQRTDGGIENILQEAQKETQRPKYGPDERIWKPTLDKAKNGYAVIRFLPAPDAQVPWAKYFDHGFKGESGKWYINGCPTTIGKPCPVWESNTKLWNSGIESDKEEARRRKRRVSFVSNIYVVKDPANPDAEGGVFLYKFGNKIFQKMTEAMEPIFADDKPMNPFNLFSGAEFKIKIKQVGGYWNYDSSEFAAPSEFMDGDEDALTKILEKAHPIKPFSDPEQFKSYNELKEMFNNVEGNVNVPDSTESSDDTKESWHTGLPVK